MSANSQMIIRMLVVSTALTVPSCANSQSAQVTVTGSLSSHVTFTSERLQFGVTLQNPGDTKLDFVQLLRPPSGYEVTELCNENDKNAVECQPFDESRSSSTHTFTVQPHASFTFWGYLRPIHTHRRETLSIVIVWKRVEQGDSVVVSLGENEVQSSLGHILSLIYDPIKTFALPVVLAYLGFILNRISVKHTELRADIEKEQSTKAEIWKQMLPSSHQFASKYYLPISTAAQNAADNLVKYALAMYGDSEIPGLGKNYSLRAFFYSALLDKRLAETKRQIGGFIFKDLRGEALAVSCWQKYRRLFVGETDSMLDVSFRLMSSKIRFQETYETFSDRFVLAMQTRPPTVQLKSTLENGWRLFQQWLERKEDVIKAILYLKGFVAVLDYELNRPYQYWYDPPPKLRLETQRFPDQRFVKLMCDYNLPQITLTTLLKKLAEEDEIEGTDEYFSATEDHHLNRVRQHGIFVIMKAIFAAIKPPFRSSL